MVMHSNPTEIHWSETLEPRRIDTLLPWKVLFGVFLVNLALRLYFIFSLNGLWGVDGGAYYLNLFRLLGENTTNNDFLRPPFAPGWTLYPFYELFGVDKGLKLWSLVTSYTMFITFIPLAYMVLKRAAWPTVIVTAFLLFDWSFAEMFTAGTLPVLGFTFMFLAMICLIWLREEFSVLIILLLALCIPAIAFTNQTSFGIFLIWLTPFLFFTWRSVSFESWYIQRLLPAFLIGGAVALLALPYYTTVHPGGDYTKYSGVYLGVFGWSNVAMWSKAIFGMAFGISALRSSEWYMRPIGSLLILFALFCPLYSYDESIENILYRSSYLIMPLLYITMAFFAVRIWDRNKAHPWIEFTRPALRVLYVLYSAVALLLLTIGWYYVTDTERYSGQMVRAGTVKAIEYLNTQSFKGTIATNSYSTSLYVGALTNHYSPWATAIVGPKAYHQNSLDIICLFDWQRNELNHRSCSIEDAINRLNVDYVLIDRVRPLDNAEFAKQTAGEGSIFATVKQRTPFKGSTGKLWMAPESEPWKSVENAPWLEKVFSIDTTEVYKVLR